MADTFKSFNKKLAKMEAELSGPKLKRHMADVGKMAKRVSENATKSDLGPDGEFSGWPGDLGTRYEHLADGVLSFKPRSKKSAGKWTTVTDGRNRGMGGFAGPGINRRTGQTSDLIRSGERKVQRQRKRKAKRWNGYTDGKGTADRATELIEKNADRMNREFVQKATRPFR